MIRKRDKILFIDDERICHTLADLIVPNFTEFTLIKAFNGAEAMNLALRYSNEIALVLTDIMLPDMNGFEIYKRLKENPKFDNVPFIFQSGYTSQELEAMNSASVDNAIKVLYKPYKKDELVKIIEDVSKISQKD